jgi:hypothetical protein
VLPNLPIPAQCALPSLAQPIPPHGGMAQPVPTAVISSPNRCLVLSIGFVSYISYGSIRIQPFWNLEFIWEKTAGISVIVIFTLSLIFKSPGSGIQILAIYSGFNLNLDSQQ